MPRIPYGDQEVDATDLEFKTRREEWNEYQLMDGTIDKMKQVVSEIFKVPDKHDDEGNPVYVVRSKNVLVVRSPDNLKRSP